MKRTAILLTVLLMVVAQVAAADKNAADKKTEEPKAAAKAADKAEAKPAQVTVVSVSGPAQKLVANGDKPTWKPIKAGDKLSELTVIRTGLRAKVELNFADEGVVVIDRATKMGIREFRTKNNRIDAKLGLKYGTVRASVQKRADPNKFEVATPVATLTVRGTGGFVGFTGDFGLGLLGTSGNWGLNSGLGSHMVGAGELSKTLSGLFTPSMQHMLGNRFNLGNPGLSFAEYLAFLRSRTGRGPLGFLNGFGRGGTGLLPNPTVTSTNNGTTENGNGNGNGHMEY